MFCGVKILSLLFYRTHAEWVGEKSADPWAHDVRLFAFLNHTSLFEPLFVSAVPFHFIWWGAPRFVAPGADKTLQRPLVGRFFKLLAPKLHSITRRRDKTWDSFLGVIVPDSLVAILPEGRMLRRTGLDKDGARMSVRGGIADILEKMDDGGMLLAYSGGLHHVQAPGEWNIRLFRKIRICFERTSVERYKEEIRKKAGTDSFKNTVIKDLEARLRKYQPNGVEVYD